MIWVAKTLSFERRRMAGARYSRHPPTYPRCAVVVALLYCTDAHPTYARNFADAGVSRADILLDDPIATLRRLPTNRGGRREGAISAEAVSIESSIGRSIVDTETSSGSAGGQKVRFITHSDNVAEHEFLAYLLSVAGIGERDRVACVDTDPAAVMVSFPRACETLGTREAYCVSVGANFEDCARLLARLEPTALVSVPSIIRRLLGAMRRNPVRSIRSIIYIGEGMSARARAIVEDELGAEVFSYYGTSETSAIGIECRAHSGVHLMSSRHVFELDTRTPSPSGSRGDTGRSDRGFHPHPNLPPSRGKELHHKDKDHTSSYDPLMGDLIATTLEQRGLPLLRYRLGDLVRVLPGRCACGLDDPRVDVLGRSGMFASILGSKIHHGALLDSLQRSGLDGPLQTTLTTEQNREVMTLRVADTNRTGRGAGQDAMMRAIMADHADIEFLADSGLLDLRFEFKPISELLEERKANSLTDLRERDGDAP